MVLGDHGSYTPMHMLIPPLMQNSFRGKVLDKRCMMHNVVSHEVLHEAILVAAQAKNKLAKALQWEGFIVALQCL